jgi:carbamoyltransferase
MNVWFSKKLWIEDEIANYLKIPTEKILFSEHHLSHAASCFYPSEFKKAAILTIDGVGEWTTTSWGIGNENKIKIENEIVFPQSLGLLYSAYTAFLGFEVNEGEWKVMGLAPYGKPTYTDKIWKTVKKMPNGAFALDFSYFSFHYSDKYSFTKKLVDLLGDPIDPKESHRITQKSADIAASIQKVTEELLIHITKNIQQKTKLENLCLAGGVALNCVANYKILKESGFKNIYIQPAAGDSGGALGAALYIYYHVLENKKRSVMETAYFGQRFTNESVEKFLISEKIGYKKLSNNALVDYVSTKIVKGNVIGWMQDEFEWGPRSLGHRSILADARNPKMKDIINSKVKFREAFRPFAPSVLEDRAQLVFELPKSPDTHLPLRFMLYVLPVKKAWQKKVPAINHADNTARPQLVYKNTNFLYYNLIHSFYKKTGVPLILNTSFNLKGEPIVSSPADAYSTFIRSEIDVLVIGNCIIEKK